MLSLNQNKKLQAIWNFYIQRENCFKGLTTQVSLDVFWNFDLRKDPTCNKAAYPTTSLAVNFFKFWCWGYMPWTYLIFEATWAVLVRLGGVIKALQDDSRGFSMILASNITNWQNAHASQQHSYIKPYNKNIHSATNSPCKIAHLPKQSFDGRPVYPFRNSSGMS